VDLDSAERIGEIDEIIIDPYAPSLAGYVVSCERSMFGQRKRIIIPTEAVHAIGPDALTIRAIDRPGDHVAHLDALPRLAELTGRRAMSFGGRLLGSVEDALVDELDARIVAYPLGQPGGGRWLDVVFGTGWRMDRSEYVRAGGGLRIGARLIVVPDRAIATMTDLAQRESDHEAAPSSGPAGAEPTLDPDEIQQAQATTVPFSLHPILHDHEPREDDADEHQQELDGRLGEPERPAPIVSAPAAPDEDTAALASVRSRRGRTTRRTQAERVR
jgi:sporulation protein YlmC with PRC-barrel domain